ncbi:hypothetical protein LX32DRAFT_709835, partial [Colletotrichum zoysiae]
GQACYYRCATNRHYVAGIDLRFVIRRRIWRVASFAGAVDTNSRSMLFNLAENCPNKQVLEVVVQHIAILTFSLPMSQFLVSFFPYLFLHNTLNFHHTQSICTELCRLAPATRLILPANQFGTAQKPRDMQRDVGSPCKFGGAQTEEVTSPLSTATDTTPSSTTTGPYGLPSN